MRVMEHEMEDYCNLLACSSAAKTDELSLVDLEGNRHVEKKLCAKKKEGGVVYQNNDRQR